MTQTGLAALILHLHGVGHDRLHWPQKWKLQCFVILMCIRNAQLKPRASEFSTDLWPWTWGRKHDWLICELSMGFSTLFRFCSSAPIKHVQKSLWELFALRKQARNKHRCRMEGPQMMVWVPPTTSFVWLQTALKVSIAMWTVGRTWTTEMQSS